MDLKIVEVGLPGKDGYWEIGIVGTTIAEMARSIPTKAKTTLSANGDLAIPGLVDAHIHLDKAYLLDRTPAIAGTFTEALRETLRAKQQFTIQDIQARARRAIERAIGFGITAMRSHVEVDTTIQLMGVQALLPLRQDYAWGTTLQLAAFAQEGITQQPGVESLLHQAMLLGADVIGSAPYVDPDPEANIRIVFEIAQRFDRPVDFHLDFLDDEAPLLLPFVIEETLRRGWQGRVCLGHMTKLAGLPPDQLSQIALKTQAAGISILALPATDLYMMGRSDTHNVRRGVAPVHQLAALGVTVGLATNNVQNLFTPFGDGDVLKICTLLAQVLQFGTIEHQHLCLDMATTQAASAIGIPAHGLIPGNLADLVLIKAKSIAEVVGAVPSDRTVFKHGKMVARSRLEQQLSPE